MRIESKRYGDIEFKNEDVIIFDRGIPGFESLKKFILKEVDEEKIFYTLHSIEEPEVALALTCPFSFKKDYEFEVDDAETEALGVNVAEEISVFSIMTLDTKKENITINLKAPVLLGKNKGKQVILDKRNYPLKFKIFEEERDACN